MNLFDFSNGDYFTLEFWYYGDVLTTVSDKVFQWRDDGNHGLEITGIGNDIYCDWAHSNGVTFTGALSKLWTGWNYVGHSVSISFNSATTVNLCFYVRGNPAAAKFYQCQDMTIGSGDLAGY
jgi:hypothetical protein